jgi:nucleosome-remodeling factor subunit BPTF
VQTKLQVLLFRHKELLKKDMIKKRALLEIELQIEIQVRKIITWNIRLFIVR